MSNDTKSPPPAEPQAEPTATGKPPKAVKPKTAKPKTAPANKPARRTVAKREAAQSDETKPAAIAVTAPEPTEVEGESRQKKEKDKKQRKKAKKKDKKNKEAVIIRFDDAQLPQIDARAEALGLSRAAWVRMVVAKALA